MAPLFGQRQKLPTDLAASGATNSEQNDGLITSNSGSGNIIRSASVGPHCSKVQDGDFQRVPPPLPPLRPQQASEPMSDTAAIRKYLVLLQDCLAIKFAPLAIGQQLHPHAAFAFNSSNSGRHDNCKRGNQNNANRLIGVAVDDEDHLLVPHRPTNFRHRRAVSNDSPKSGSNSITDPLTNNVTCNNGHGNRNGSHQQTNFTTLRNLNGGIHNNGDPQQAFHLQSHHKSTHLQERLEQFHFLHSEKTTSSTSSSGLGTLSRSCLNNNNYGVGGVLGSSTTAEVDHSLHALYLYKGFKEANVQCHWNAGVSETFRNIQYKGYIVPSTILVSALPKFLSILRTAWARQMLRCPVGYRIEFIGEIEEVIADPIQKGQFAPLSDSLCWAILELTSLGQEAFVDSIMSALQGAFPTMSCPSRELVFQTLEKLIKERKVYQTSRGYFVVTPEIFRYMAAANFQEFENAGTPQMICSNNHGITLDALVTSTSCPDHDKLSFSHQSWDSAASAGDHNRCSSTSTGEELIEIAPSPKLKRHNSLKLIRQRDLTVTRMTGSTGQRRHSMRLPKSKSCGRMNEASAENDLDEEVKTRKVKSSTIEHISRAMRSFRVGNLSNADCATVESEKSKKNKSLLSKLFPFRRSTSKPRNYSKAATNMLSGEKSVSGSSCSTTNSSNGSVNSSSTKAKHSENAKDCAKFISTQTQTSSSTERLASPSLIKSHPHPGSSSPPTISPAVIFNEQRTIGKRTATVVDSSAEHSDAMLQHPRDASCGGSHQTRSSSRRSMSAVDESPLYDVLHDVPSSTTPPGANNFAASAGGRCNHHVSPNFQLGYSVAPPTFPAFRGESSRCSTLSSQATSSLGYGSQGHPSLASNYSPNMESGLASLYGYYQGDGSVNGSSHSPLGTTPPGHYGCTNSRGSNNGNGDANIFPQPTKLTPYSSSNYKSSYEWYRKRYPNYTNNHVGRSSPLYASLTAPRSKSRSRPTYESLLTTTDERNKRQPYQMSGEMGPPVKSDTLTVNVGDDNNPGSDVMRSIDDRENSSSTVSTATVTQAVKSTTNMELELLLPLGKIMKAALQAKKDAIREAWLKDELGPNYALYANKGQQETSPPTTTTGNEFIKLNLDNSGAKLRVGEPSTKTEVTTVVDNNGVIETHFDSSSGADTNLSDLLPRNMKSTVEIKTLGGIADIVLVDGRTGKRNIKSSSGGHTLKNNNAHSAAESQSRAHLSNNSNAFEKILDKRPTGQTSCVKITDIGKDCGADEDVIQAY